MKTKRIEINIEGKTYTVYGTGDHEHFEAEGLEYNGEDITEILDYAVFTKAFWSVCGVKAAEGHAEYLEGLREQQIEDRYER